MEKATLIFPAGMPAALKYLEKCLREKRLVIGASSLGYDASREKYPAWVRLPYVTEPDFDIALRQALIDFGVGEIYTPNIVVWNHLNKVLGDLLPEVTLVNASPVDEALNGYRSAIKKAGLILSDSIPLASSRLPCPPPSEIELAALIRHADLIPGMCDDAKFEALCNVVRNTAKGDLVEIGSWWGKSAFILASLARQYGIGNLLCVDPWANEHLIQNESLVDNSSAEVDANEALAVFEMSLLPYNHGHINYLRMTSAEGAVHYRSAKRVSSSTFGATNYVGKIALLHIDGNHLYSAVKADILAWSDLVVPGGWIVVDDYIWPYGDGPKIAGDELLADKCDLVECAFVMGGALFIALSDQII